MQDFISFGQWWIPSKPEVRIPGTLSFSSDRDARLELMGSFYDGSSVEKDITSDVILADQENLLKAGMKELEFIEPEEIIILGLIENNEEITLYKCSGRIANFDFVESTHTLVFYAKYILRKIHISNEESIKFKSIAIEYSYFREWVGKSGITPYIKKDDQVLIKSHPLENIYLTKINDLDISITCFQMFNQFENRYFGTAYYKINIEQKTYLTISNYDNKSLSECIDLFIHFRDFLSFAMSKPTSIISVEGKLDVPVPRYINKEEFQEQEIIILFGLGGNLSNSETKLSLHDMLFTFNDMEDRLGEIFTAWINNQEKYTPVFQLLMTTIYTPNLYINYGFINIIQALESYHSASDRFKDKGKYQKSEKYKDGIYKKLLEVIEDFARESVGEANGISDDFRAALKGKIKGLNQITLQTRLNQLIKNISDLLPSNFIGDVQDRELFASRASKTRNAWTHHDEKEKEKAAKGNELIQLFHTLTVILQVCLLRELNFTDDSIKKVISRNTNYQRQWRSPSN
ncbi:HEPN domain-containing protein [Anabaena sp. WFMT]|uniref:ApeA N-terminal domain 1-containing protein n=1 Tax=Anabaena sp. WFMT TaxID=3449730 RepID=UPI003F2377A5